MTLLLGAIADDATGATDLANTLVKQGLPTVQVIGVPDETIAIGAAEAVVVALKSRTAPVDAAVRDSLAALGWLQRRDVEQVFFKYCSTFDSTSAGNIGPVADAFLAALDTDFAVVCPAFPANQRTVYQGHLFVGRDLLSASSMRDHPLTPMTESNLVRLMAAQSARRVGLVPWAVVREGFIAVEEALDALRMDGIAYAVVDAIEDADLITIGRAAAGHRLVTGGSGVALGLPDNFRARGLLGGDAVAFVPRLEGRSVVLAGSCSAATRAQLDAVRGRWPCRQLDVAALMSGAPVVEETLAWTDDQNSAAPIVIATSQTPEEVHAIQKAFGRDAAGQAVEAAFGAFARRLVDAGARRLVVAGGETSGAVLAALDVRALSIGAEIAPGVPWTETIPQQAGEPALALALKSGNFGDSDFFEDAFAMLEQT